MDDIQHKILAEQIIDYFKCNPDVAYMHVNEIEELAESGDLLAQVELWQHYMYGVTVKMDKQKGIKWLKIAAKNGDAFSQWNLGDYYQFEIHDMTKASAWFSLSAIQGDSEGQWKAGYCYYFGEGVKKNIEQALNWYKKSAAQGNSNPMWLLGKHYEEQNNMKEAAKWFEMGAELGNEHAQCNIGDCYLYGEGVPKDKLKAIYWYKEASKHGNTYAKEVLSRITKP